MAGRSPPSTGSDESYHSAHGDDRWVLDRNIGAGGFGVVKLYVNQVTGQQIVLKECRLLNLSNEIMERWQGELEILKRLDHLNIVKAQNVPEGLDYLIPMSNTPFICMEYCDGGDLRQVLRDPENCCGLTEMQIRQICHDINYGIRFLHSQKVIHRDLKPENILLKKLGDGKVIYKLTDFGYAKSYDQSSVCTSLVGTMQYVAPEVLKDKKYHSSVDFWSFGVVVFECITGKRPFLHGDPAVAFGWVDFVAKKGPKDINIYWGQDDTRPIYSSTVPQPHRLSKPFEARITSWLQIALQYNPEMRGGRRIASEDAPCLTNIDHILNTKIVNAVCTSTGEVYSIEITDTLTMDGLKQQIFSHTAVPPSEQLFVLPNGHIPQDTEQATVCIQQDNVGTVCVFTTALEPSFKMIHNTSPAVQSLIAYGDEKIHHEDRREVYSHVFFHIREQYSFFERLHTAHRALLYMECCRLLLLMTSQCLRRFENSPHVKLFTSTFCPLTETFTHITKQHDEIGRKRHCLPSSFHCTAALASFVQEMHTCDISRLRTLHDERKVLPPGVITRTLEIWNIRFAQLQQTVTELQGTESEVYQLRQEADTIYTLADDVQQSYAESDRSFHDYYHHYVVKARDIYHDVKVNRGSLTGGRMHDILLGATQEANNIIQEKLNGINFARQFVVQKDVLRSISTKGAEIADVEKKISNINDERRRDLWQLIQHETLPGVNQLQYGKQVSKHSSGSSEGGNYFYTQRSHRPSVTSMDSSDFEVSSNAGDIALEESLERLSVSQDQNDRVLDKNTEIMTRLHSLMEVHTQGSVADVASTHPLAESALTYSTLTDRDGESYSSQSTLRSKQ